VFAVLNTVSLSVVATAALLAGATDSQLYSSKSEQCTATKPQRGSSVFSIDASSVAESDHLIDAGDWQGKGLLFYVELLRRIHSGISLSLDLRSGFGGS
jgi:hypothetical protein